MKGLVELEEQAFKFAEDAYFKAAKTSDPHDWMEAALFAQQHRNVLVKLRTSLGDGRCRKQD